MSDSELKRLAVGAHVFDLLRAEVKALRQKGSYVKVNESKLAAAVIELFFEKYLSREREQLAKRFFDRKSYLKTIIDSSMNDDELSESLSKYMEQSRSVRKVKPLASSEKHE